MFTAQHQYLTIIGDAYGTTERWQFGLRLTDGGVSNQATALAVADDVEAWWRGDAAPYAPDNGFMPTNLHRLTELKCARLDVEGQYPAGEASYSHFYVPPIVGNMPAIQGMVPQATVCVTLMTALPRGLASKGRVFLPHSYHQDLLPSGLMLASEATVIANSIKLLIDSINANATVGNVAIFSRGKAQANPSPDGKKIIYTYPNLGATNNVTTTRCGRVVDTQRRRRRSLIEAPSTATV